MAKKLLMRHARIRLRCGAMSYAIARERDNHPRQLRIGDSES